MQLSTTPQKPIYYCLRSLTAFCFLFYIVLLKFPCLVMTSRVIYAYEYYCYKDPTQLSATYLDLNTHTHIQINVGGFWGFSLTWPTTTRRLILFSLKFEWEWSFAVDFHFDFGEEKRRERNGDLIIIKLENVKPSRILSGFCV